MELKQCKTCGEYKPITRFTLNRTYRASECMDCKNKRDRENNAKQKVLLEANKNDCRVKLWAQGINPDRPDLKRDDNTRT